MKLLVSLIFFTLAINIASSASIYSGEIEDDLSEHSNEHSNDIEIDLSLENSEEQSFTKREIHETYLANNVDGFEDIEVMQFNQIKETSKEGESIDEDFHGQHLDMHKNPVGVEPFKSYYDELPAVSLIEYTK